MINSFVEMVQADFVSIGILSFVILQLQSRDFILTILTIGIIFVLLVGFLWPLIK